MAPGIETTKALADAGAFVVVPARVVAVSSVAHRHSAMRWDDVMFTRGYDKWHAYGQSKTANSLFALRLDELAEDQGVGAFSLHPGGIHTPLQRHLPREEMIALGTLRGLYLEDCDVAGIRESDEMTAKGVYAVDPDEAARLWDYSVELTGEDAVTRG